MSLQIVRVVLDAPIDKSFDYRYQPSDGDEGMPQVGQLVAVPFGRRSVVGLVVSTGSSTDVPAEKLKDIAHCYHNIPSFDKAWLNLCRFAASRARYPAAARVAGARRLRRTQTGNPDPVGAS